MLLAVNNLHIIVKTIVLQTAILSALLSVGVFLSGRKNLKNQVFAGLFFVFSLNSFYFFLYESKLLHTYPYISALCLSGMFLIGPMIFFLSALSVNKDFKFSNKKFLHFIPVIVAVVTSTIAVYVSKTKEIPEYLNFFFNRAILVLGALGACSFFIYLGSTGFILLKNFVWNWDNFKKEPPALASLLVFIVFLTISVTDILALTTGKEFFLQLSALLLSFCIILLFLINSIFPGFNTAISNLVEKEKSKRSYLLNVDKLVLINKIENLIYTENIYTDSHLTLQKFALLVDLNPHQLSEFINDHYGKNFVAFLNEFRINKAKELLISKPYYTMVAIAFEAGFNSKSAFNDAFRKNTGLSPTDFKNENKV